MAKFLALEWGPREARVAVARTRGDSIILEHAFAVDLGARDPGQTFSDEVINEKLAEALTSRGLGRIETLVAVGRASIELRQLSLPPSPPEELPDLVRFQAMREFTTIGDDWALDFVQLDTSEDETSSVLAAAISPEMISQISSTCQSAASSPPKRLALRPFAAASLLRRHDRGTTQPCRLMVDLLADEADLTAMLDESVVLMRTVRLAITDDGTVQSKALLGEIRRTIASAQNQLRGRRVEKVVLCGDGSDQQTLKQEIEDGLSLTVELFDPFQELEVDASLSSNRPEHPGRFAPLLGMLMDEAAGATHPIDFLNPRKRPEPPSQTRRYSVIGGAIAATLVVLAAGIYFKLSSLDAGLEAMRAESASLAEDVKTANESISKARSVEKFLNNDITWLDELYAMAEQLPPQDQAIFTQLSMNNRPSGGAQIVLDGFAREADDITKVRDSLRVEDRRIDSNGTSNDPRRKDYPWRFKETVELVKTISTSPTAASSDGNEVKADPVPKESSEPAAATQETEA
ncbi:MAG: hypothetical protein H8E66_31020 [Planctomycetes bacterium]|nr:hypothetical protein [Planctomycetota bacterium]